MGEITTHSRHCVQFHTQLITFHKQLITFHMNFSFTVIETPELFGIIQTLFHTFLAIPRPINHNISRNPHIPSINFYTVIFG